MKKMTQRERTDFIDQAFGGTEVMVLIEAYREDVRIFSDDLLTTQNQLGGEITMLKDSLQALTDHMHNEFVLLHKKIDTLSLRSDQDIRMLFEEIERVKKMEKRVTKLETICAT